MSRTKIKCILLLAAVCSSLLSCNRTSSIEGATIHIENNEVGCLDLSETLNVKGTTALSDEVMLGIVRNAFFVDSYYFVWSEEQIYRFSENGELLNPVGKLGRGPQEYVSIINFTVGDGKVAVLTKDSKVLLYKYDGTFIAQSEIPYIASSCSIFNGALVVASGCQDKVERVHLYSLDSMEETTSFGEVDEADMTYRHFMYQDNFYQGKKECIFHESMNNSVYSVSKKGIELLYSFDFWGKTPSESFWKEKYSSVVDVVMALTTGQYVHGISFYATGNGKHLMTYTDHGFKMACHTSEGDAQSSKIQFGSLTDEMPLTDVNLAWNRSDALLFFVQPEYVSSGAPDGQQNPMIIRAQF